jgi:uncharacterized protein
MSGETNDASGEGTSEPQPQWGVLGALAGLAAVLVVSVFAAQVLIAFTGDDGLDFTLGAQAILALSLVGVALGFANSRVEGSPAAALGLRRPGPGWVKTAALGYGAYFVFVIFVVSVIGEPEQTDFADRLGFDENVAAAIAAGVLLVVVAPFCEELFFRGFFFGGLRQQVPFPVAAGISAVLFGVVHLGEANLIAGLQLTFLGLVLATVYERTGSIWPNIAIHALNNALAFTVLVAS